MRRRRQYHAPIDKKGLREAFGELRKRGYFARQNFLCCQSCAWAAVPEEKADKAVFYHNQDNQRLEATGKCHLAWAGNGQEIVDVLQAHGVKTTWDGTSGQRIEIELERIQF